MNQLPNKFIAGGFSLALVLLSGVGFASYLNIKQLEEDKQWVVHTYEVLGKIKDMNAGILNAQSNSRGYIIAGKASYINNYKQNKHQVYQTLNNLRYLTKDNLTQQRKLDAIEPLINQRFSFFDEYIKLFWQNNQDLANLIKFTEENQQLKETIQKISQEMDNEERSLLQKRTKQTNERLSKIIAVVTLASCLGFFLIITIYLLLHRQILINKFLSQEAICLEKLAAKAKLSSFLESTTDAFVALDNNWNYIYVNKKAGDIFNRQPEDLIGKNIWDEFPEGVGQKFYHAYHKAMREQRQIQIEEYYPPWNRWYENRIYPSKEGLCIFFQDITYRKEAEFALQSQIQFDRIVARISTGFINLKSAEIPDKINQALAEISEFSHVDTSFITKFADDKSTLSMIYEWVAPGFVAQIQNIQNINYDLFSWANAKATRGEIVNFANLDSLPEEAKIDRENWRQGNIKSLISIPLSYQGKVFGVLGFATITQEKIWSEDSIKLLRIVGEIFTNALQGIYSALALQQQEQRWQLAIQGNNDGIWNHDLISDRHFLSGRCREMLGYEDSEVKTFGEWFNLIHPKDQEVLTKAFQAHLNRQTPLYSSEYRMRCKDGSYKWLLARGQAMWDEAGTPIRAVGSITDITERKLAEAAILKLNQELETKVKQRTAALQKSEAHLAEAQRVGHVGSWEFDLITQKVSWSNETFRIFGRNPQLGEPTYEKFLQYIHPEDREIHTTEFNKGIVEKKLVEINYRVLRSDGSLGYFRAVGKPFFNDNGEPLRYVGTVMDITESVLAEQQLQKLNQELLRSNQELEQFASVASHDLQEPLRAISSYIKFLEEDYQDKFDKSGREYIHFISDATSRMQQLIRDLLAYARVSTHGKEFITVDCNQVLEDAIFNLRAAIIESNATITRDSLPIVLADKGQLVQLFQNLIANAIKFCTEKPPQIHIGFSQMEDKNLFWVRDNGIGIQPQYLEDIFQVFRRLHTRGEFPGTGIGLAICKKIVERHGGKIWVESEVGVGSTFILSL